MKRIIIAALFGLILTSATVSLISCGNDFLEVDAYSIVSPEGVYSDKKNVFKGLIGVYYTLLGAGDYYIKPHPALANYPTLDVQADGWDAEMSTHSWTVESKSAFFENAWIYSYKTVVACNLFLRDLEDVDETVLSASEKAIYEAETRAIRGSAYYYLTVNFSRVPMLMTGETYQTSPTKERPESDAEAWSTILSDFEYAASVLDWKPADGMTGRFTKGAALAYAGKACMYLGDYDKAKQYYKQIIDNGTSKLNPCFAMTSWVDNPGNVEALWEISFPKFPGMGWDVWTWVQNGDCRYFGMQTKAREYGGWGDSFTSYELVRSFEPGDKRKTYSIVGWHGDKGDTNPYTGDVIGKNEGFQTWFLSNAEGNPNNHGTKWWRTDDVYSAHSVNLYRFGGALLDYAECCFRTSDEAAGWDAIRQIRNRAWGNLEVGYDPDADSGSYLPFPKEMLNTATVPVPDAQTHYTNYAKEKGYTSPVWMVALFQERRKELYYEFSLWYDLCRCNFVEEWLNCEYPKNGGATFYNTSTGKYYVPSGIDYNEPWDNASEAERASMIPVTPRVWDWNPIHLVYPIPTSELTANSLCDQNPGY